MASSLFDDVFPTGIAFSDEETVDVFFACVSSLLFSSESFFRHAFQWKQVFLFFLRFDQAGTLSTTVSEKGNISGRRNEPNEGRKSMNAF